MLLFWLAIAISLRIIKFLKIEEKTNKSEIINKKLKKNKIILI